MPRITLLSDFGTRDGYVGAMKGVIASIFPGVVMDDVSHEVEPGNISAGSLALSRYWRRYPAGTIHVAVVDPGVGTGRRALAAEVDRRLFVAPDNGILERILGSSDDAALVSIEDPEYTLPNPSATFHGRDIFAPAAAYLALGVHLTRLGPKVSDPVRLSTDEVLEHPDALIGRVIALDRFGNLLTNLDESAVAQVNDVEVEGRAIPVVDTYASVAPESLAAVVNSDGMVEVAARDGSAASLLGVGVGTRVRVQKIPRPE